MKWSVALSILLSFAVCGCNPDDLAQAKKLSKQIKTERELHQLVLTNKEKIIGWLGNDAYLSLAALRLDPSPTKNEALAIQFNQSALNLATPSTDIVTLQKQLAAALASAKGEAAMRQADDAMVASLKGQNAVLQNQLTQQISKTDAADVKNQQLAAKADADWNMVHAWLGIPYLFKQNLKWILIIIIPAVILFLFAWIAQASGYPPAQLAGTIITDIFSTIWAAFKSIWLIITWCFSEVLVIFNPKPVIPAPTPTTPKTA